MKNFAFLIFILFINSICYSQWNSDGRNIWNTNCCNVGIGDGNYFIPSYKLHVKGDVFSEQNLRWNSGRSLLSTDQGGSVELGDGYGHHGGFNYPDLPFIDFHWGLDNIGQDFNTRIMNAADNQLDFATNFNGTFMTLRGDNSSSNGLPYLKLTNNNGIGNTLKFQCQTGELGIEFWNFGGSLGIIDFYADYLNHPEYTDFSIKSDHGCCWGNDWNWLSADQGGEQGSSIHLNGAGLNPSAIPYIGFTHGYSFQSNRIDVAIKNSGYDQLDFFTNLDASGNGGNKIMTIKDDGVFAKKITVQSSWSDFVFKSQYKLKSLSEVEKYIKENGHLEGIPSEQEVKENGIELGDASSKLLQKIEELTMYVINQNKEIQKLKEDNDKLKEVIEKK